MRGKRQCPASRMPAQQGRPDRNVQRKPRTPRRAGPGRKVLALACGRSRLPREKHGWPSKRALNSKSGASLNSRVSFTRTSASALALAIFAASALAASWDTPSVLPGAARASCTGSGSRRWNSPSPSRGAMRSVMAQVSCSSRSSRCRVSSGLARSWESSAELRDDTSDGYAVRVRPAPCSTIRAVSPARSGSHSGLCTAVRGRPRLLAEGP